MNAVNAGNPGVHGILSGLRGMAPDAVLSSLNFFYRPFSLKTCQYPAEGPCTGAEKAFVKIGKRITLNALEHRRPFLGEKRVQPEKRQDLSAKKAAEDGTFLRKLCQWGW